MNIYAAASRIRPLCLLILFAFVSIPFHAQPEKAGNVDRNLAWQIALDREGFSPGVIDGKPGAKTNLATSEFQRARGLAVTGNLDDATALALRLGAYDVLKSYTIQQADLDQVIGKLPANWVAKSQLKFLGYESLGSCLAERFHCSTGLLASLNPKVNFANLKATDTICAPCIVKPSPGPLAKRLEINLAQKVIRVFGTDDKLIALFHCSIAANPAKRPSGEATVTSVTVDPIYCFDPAMWPEVKNVDQKLMIAPGPRNPVGRCWIALSLRGYGIHGTPNPEMIGKTGSHGCFRMTNWDAMRLGMMVRAGTTVVFVGGGASVAQM